jgi:hypothetical protein
MYIYMYCEACMKILHTPSVSRLCVPGHMVAEVVVGGDLVFSGEERKMKDCVRLLREEWGLEKGEDE